jgi:general secretion pathway protein H
MQVATLLKRDRNAALQQGGPILTQVDAPTRRISSGASDRVVQVAHDVDVEALLPKICNGHPARSNILFFPNGTSCGGVIRLTRLGSGFDVRVNWLTGGVEIVGHSIL